MPLLALVFALGALVLLPVLRARLVEPLHNDLRSQIEPARGVVTRIHLALAMEGTLAREFMERRDTLLLAGYREALADELAAYKELAPHIDRLGPSVRSEFNAVKLLQLSWHDALERSFNAPPVTASRSLSSRDGEDPFHPAQYERLLVGAARLDEALSNAADKRWAEAAATNRIQRWLSIVVGLIALIAAMIVAWLGRGLRLYAVAADRDRRELERALDARARLVRGITHDLKNPLTAIIGYTELLAAGVKGPLSPDQRASVDRIDRSARSLLSLIDDLLNMEGDVIRTVTQNINYIGHFHTGGVPGRHEIDDTQELNYHRVMQAIADAKFPGFVAQEFVPTKDPRTSLAEAVAICTV